jgi:NADH-ubiquinone oxidoreductase chain 4
VSEHVTISFRDVTFIEQIMTLSKSRLCGSCALRIAHTLCFTGLFCLDNILYEQLHSLRLLANNGLINSIVRMIM